MNHPRAIRLLILAVAVMFASGALPGQQANPPAQTQTAPAPQKTRKAIDPDATAGVRGLGLPLTIEVRRQGRPVASASIVVKTDAGIIVGKGETDSTGNLTLKLEPGDYSIAATAGDSVRKILYTVAATSGATTGRIAIEM